MTCVDTPDWNNFSGRSCADYGATWCFGGAARPGHEWTMGATFNFPEQHCCACGKPFTTAAARAALPVAIAPPIDAPFEEHHNRFCAGADHEVREPDVDACRAHCVRQKCACFAFKKGMWLCRFTLRYAGLQHSSAGFSAYVRPGTPEVGSESVAAAAAAVAVVPGVAGPPAPCVPSGRRYDPPSFYLYDLPALDWAVRLAKCFEERVGLPPWKYASTKNQTRDGAPPAQLAHALWLRETLRSHPRRVAAPDKALLFVALPFGSLSEAVGSCDGVSHSRRMDEAAAALQQSPWWGKAASRHVVLATALEDDSSPLGELGTAAAAAGAVGLCVEKGRCSGFKRTALIPPLPSPLLLAPNTRGHVAHDACVPDGVRRRASVFFRGPHASDSEAQQLRARLWALRAYPGADVKFTVGGGGRLDSDVRSWLGKNGWTKDIRVPLSADAGASGALHADFCFVVKGDHKLQPVQDLTDAVAAGCVPILLGVNPKDLPLPKALDYSTFTLTIDDLEFRRYPLETAKTALEAAAPKLPELRKALAVARDGIVLGYGAAPREGEVAPAHGADAALLQAGRAVCPRSPSSLGACFPELKQGL